MKVRLGDVCERGSSSIRQSDIEDLAGDYPIYGASGLLGNVSFYHQANPYIAVVKDGAGIGKTMLLPPKSSVIGTLQYLLPKENILPQYLYYAVRFMHLEKYFSGATIPHIYFRDYRNEEFNLDSLEKQAEIITILRSTEQVISYCQNELDKLDKLVRARFFEMFGDMDTNPMNWPQVCLSEVTRGKASNGYFAKREEYINTGNASVLGVANVVNRMYSQCDGLPKTNIADDNIKKYELQYGDVLFCRSSLIAEGIGKASIVPKDVPDNTVFECHVIRVPLNTDICVPEFIQVLTTTDYYRHQVLRHAKTATMTTISQDGILNTSIILPPIHIQKSFYTLVSQIEKTKAAVQSALDKAQLLFDSLMQKYFG